MQPILTNLEKIAVLAAEKDASNDQFRRFLKQQDSATIDVIVHRLNDVVTRHVDCTQCGNCCKSLMINVTLREAEALAGYLQMSLTDTKEKYIEESEQGQLIINTIPCHFLAGTTCSIYPQRFTECREFPHLHKPHFTSRLLGTMGYYAMCPIIFNVVEQLKDELDFIPD